MVLRPSLIIFLNFEKNLRGLFGRAIMKCIIYIVSSLSITFGIMSAMQYRMLIRMSLCRAIYDFTLASDYRFAKCIRTYDAPCTFASLHVVQQLCRLI
jgi:hypothetical protein